MTSREFDIMMAEALTRIGMNVPSLKSRFAHLDTWEKNAVRNHSLIATYGPAAIAEQLESVIDKDEDTGILTMSYIRSIALNFRRMEAAGDDGDRPLVMPREMPERCIKSYCDHLRRYGSTVCRGEFLERFGAEEIRRELLEHGCDADVDVIRYFFEPMTVTVYDHDGTGYAKVAAIMPTVRLSLRKDGDSKR